MHGMGSPRVLGPSTPWPRNESRKKSSFSSLSALKGGFQMALGSWELSQAHKVPAATRMSPLTLIFLPPRTW